MENGKITKGLPTIRRPKLSENHKRRRMRFKKYEANTWWNGWKFQLNWHKLEWVIPRIKIKREKPFRFLQSKLHTYR